MSTRRRATWHVEGERSWTARLTLRAKASALSIALGAGLVASGCEDPASPRLASDTLSGARSPGAIFGDTVMAGGGPNEVLVFGWDEASGWWGERARLTLSEGWTSTGQPVELGAIALSDRLALIAQVDSDGGVFVLERVGEQWVERQIIERGPGTVQLALSGQTALIGATSDGVYVYEHEDGAFVEKQRLDLAEDEIGPSMALDGDLAIVGARHVPTGRGPVVFARDGEMWVAEQELQASVGELQPDANYPGLTGCVALSGDTALVGGSHGAFLFVREDGQWQERLRIGCGEACGEEARQTCPVALSGAVGVVSGHTTLRRLQGVWTAVPLGTGGDWLEGLSLAGEQLLESSLGGSMTVYDLRQIFPSPTYDRP